MLLNDQISEKATQTREEASSFESSLASEFRKLTTKSGENLKKVHKQIDLFSEIVESEKSISNKITIISAMFSKNSLLETLVYSKINDKLDKFPKKTEEEVEVKEQVESSPPPEKEETTQPESPPKPTANQPEQKLSKGGVTPPTGYDTSDKVKSNLLPYANTLTLPLEAAGIAAVSVLSEFIKGTGSLGGFFKPYLKSIINPFALALGVNQNVINTFLGIPLQRASLELRDQQRYFGKVWGKFLNDAEFVGKYIDREIISTLKKGGVGGYVPANWKDDPEFVAELNRVAQKFNINANDLLAVMLVETGGTLSPSIRNPTSDATGLIQFMPDTAVGLGTTIDDLARMTRAQQMKYVEKYLTGKLPQGASGGQIYAAVFLPAFINEEILTVRGEAYYNANTGLDYNRDGMITRSDLNEHVEAMKKRYKLYRGDSIGNTTTPLSPYLLSGPDAGYDVNIQGYNVTLHGEEVIVPFTDGFQVYPVKNRRYDISKDPLGVSRRWKQIAHGSNTSSRSFSSGGSAEFWKIAALVSREDSLHPQGQADVAQTIYNRAAVGSYPGGKNISAIITAPGQFAPTFGNVSKWVSIKDRQSAISAAGKGAAAVDMAAKSITNPSLQKESQKFLGGRTDFQGESQKKFMKPGDITRGSGYNFHGWFYDARLDKPAPIPKIVSSQTRISAAESKPTPRLIIHRVSTPSQPNIIEQAQRAVTTFTNMIFNPRKVKSDLNMRRAR